MAKQEKPKQKPTLKIIPMGDAVSDAEQIKEQFYELLLPEEFQELRQYLGNDGFLSNDEISAALRDGRLEREELAEKLAARNLPSEDKTLQEKMTDYLWELHQIIQDPTLDKIQVDQRYQVQTIQPFPDSEREPSEEAERKAGKKSDKSLEIVNGGLLANFLHNFKKAYNLDQNPLIEMEKKTRYQWQDVEAALEKMGLRREVLAESGNLERLLKGEKTGVIDFKSEYNGQETAMRGKIYLVKQGEEITPYFQSVKQTLQVPEKYLGYTLSQEDKETLAQKGELGKRVELEDYKTKQKFDAYIGVDKDTNSLTVWRADRVHIPMQIKGVTLSKEQQETLQQGGAIRLAGLTSENGQKFDADIQISAGKRSLSFSPMQIKGVTLSKEQQETLQQGGAIRLAGLTSENGQKFDADIQISAGKRSLSFSPPSEAIKQTLDVKTAKDVGRSSDQLQGTSAGSATTKDKLPEQKQKKTESKNRGIEPEQAKTGEPAAKNEPGKNKSQGKNKKTQKDQGLSV